MAATQTQPATAVAVGSPDTFEYETKGDKTGTGVATVLIPGYDFKTKAYYFTVSATGKSSRNAKAVAEQSFFVIGPGS